MGVFLNLQLRYNYKILQKEGLRKTPRQTCAQFEWDLRAYSTFLSNPRSTAKIGSVRILHHTDITQISKIYQQNRLSKMHLYFLLERCPISNFFHFLPKIQPLKEWHSQRFLTPEISFWLPRYKMMMWPGIYSTTGNHRIQSPWWASGEINATGLVSSNWMEPPTREDGAKHPKMTSSHLFSNHSLVKIGPILYNLWKVRSIQSVPDVDLPQTIPEFFSDLICFKFYFYLLILVKHWIRQSSKFPNKIKHPTKQKSFKEKNLPTWPFCILSLWFLLPFIRLSPWLDRWIKGLL